MIAIASLGSLMGCQEAKINESATVASANWKALLSRTVLKSFVKSAFARARVHVLPLASACSQSSPQLMVDTSRKAFSKTQS